ncbi:dUTP diphosphatase [Lysinibacillus fusiformis]|uniref:Deoxyuridine 5'-triphosphate nucleotidohydrolase n=1 Tax=Lysinibacillus fusiformis TaxID=28031 RepID=A0A1H9CC15_9BACI|nr:dUTP diphosphatase [Lysinibacillus fusiformis]HAU35221.1 dUTP diphosphatase [Lysinibacillus sp.]MCG7434367.1 dUTP diphosphatase [Lysinibacillus fusiformis]SCY00884.1 deoxyuridine 5'-triphosphate nucleotidohydrolase [Lysinibacillus fusiformis]SEN16724.1 deoxyuridine 5'-triphosphate nucleotidohydrolase [Lysinibacillus fusiformis]SEP98551.1 deoxyuridine 5'-triphosphate nucleotidohydrolase [Lysinibacillus fusiformis]
MNVEVKIKRMHADAMLPMQANPGDAGMDLYSIETVEIPAGGTKLIKTGIQIELPKGTEAQIRPRSGLALKHSITVLNSPGTIDEGYRGEIGVILINHGQNTFLVEKSMRIAQMVIQFVPTIQLLEVNELSQTVRGTSGFGASGTK